jgi:hypothetical protein
MLFAVTVLVPAVVGLIAHNGFFKRGEWHMSIPNVLSIHLIVGLTALYFLNSALGSLQDALVSTLVAYASYFAALFSSMTVYRLFFHRTAHFPGPKLAAVSKFWHIWYIRDSRNYLFLQKLHEKYGDFVRTGIENTSIYGWMGC